MAGKRVTPAEVVRFHELYKQYGTFTEVAKQTGRSASCVRKHISRNTPLGKATQTIITEK